MTICYDGSISNDAYCKTCQAILSNFKCSDSLRTNRNKTYFVISNALSFVFNLSDIYFISQDQNKQVTPQYLQSTDFLIRYVLKYQVYFFIVEQVIKFNLK